MADFDISGLLAREVVIKVEGREVRFSDDLEPMLYQRVVGVLREWVAAVQDGGEFAGNEELVAVTVAVTGEPVEEIQRWGRRACVNLLSFLVNSLAARGLAMTLPAPPSESSTPTAED